MSRYDDPLAKAIYEGRMKAAWGPAWLMRPQWPMTKSEKKALEHNGGDVSMDLAVAAAEECRKRGLAK